MFVMKGKILLFVPPIFEYNEIIKDALKKKGFEVDYFTVEYGAIKINHGSLLQKIKIKIKHLLKPNILINELNEIEKFIINKSYDYLIAIGHFPLNSKIIKHLKLKNKNIQTYLYLWDEFKVLGIKTTIFRFFDKVFTFNRPDLVNFKKKERKNKSKYYYLPNFYICNPHKNKTHKKDIDILFIGSINYDTLNRFSLLNKLINIFIKNNLKYCINLRYNLKKFDKSYFSKILKFFSIRTLDSEKYNLIINKYLKIDTYKILTHRTVPFNGIQEAEAKTTAIIDLNHTNREGYSLNVISAIGNNLKLITTNHFILNESFYSSNNILIIDENIEENIVEFLNKPNIKKDISHLEINNWVDLILDEKYYNSKICDI